MLAFIGYGLSAKKLFSWTSLETQRQEIIAAYSSLVWRPPSSKKKRKKIRKHFKTKEVIHPYLGYIVRHGDPDCPSYGFCDRRMKKNKNAPITQKTDNNFIIGISGGSFAYQTSLISTEGLLIKELKRIPQLREKEIIIHTMALGGYKQPQQLIALNYFLTLGAHFDMIINIDGFNEVALAGPENLTKEVHYSFPRQWANRVRKASNAEMRAMLGKIALYKQQQSELAERMNSFTLRYSIIANLIWQLRNESYKNKISDIEIAFNAYKTEGRRITPFEATGPPYQFIDNETYAQDMARFWRKSSLLMHQICQANKIKYFHFLQPNQYVKGSKRMGEKEKEIAILDTHPYSIGAKSGYPYLIEEGKWLKENGVPFNDLTMLFADTDEAVYSDGCCHLNQHGYDIVIKEIADVVRTDYRNKGIANTSTH